MHALEEKVIEAFKRRPDKPLSTSQLVNEVFPDVSSRIKHDLRSPDNDVKKQAKRLKAKLHRKLLYHLGKLTTRKVIQVHHIKEHGEKLYTLAVSTGEIVIQDKNSNLSITKFPSYENFISQELNEGSAVSMSNALYKVEAYAIDCSQYPGIHHLLKDMRNAYSNIEDAIGLLDFQHFLKQDEVSLQDGLIQLVIDSKDYTKAITLHIDISKRRLTNKDVKTFTEFALQAPRRLYLVIYGEVQDLIQQHKKLSSIATEFAKNRVKFSINLKRENELDIMGRGGLYKINKERMKTKGVVVSPASYAIDLSKFNKGAKEFQELLIRIAKTLLSRMTLQRREADGALRGLQEFGTLKEQLQAETPYIRFWNFELTDEFNQLLASSKEELEKFCMQEETIYGASGVPINFNVRLSTAFPHYGELTERTYNKQPVKGIKSLDEEMLRKRERTSVNFACDRVRVFRDGIPSGDQVLNEMMHIMKNYNFTFLTYDFKPLQTIMTLEQFL